MPYIGVSPQFGVRKKHTYTATAGQTSFSGAGSEGATLSYKDSNFVDVYQNGVKLGDADYTSTSGTAIVLAQGASVDDLVEIIVFDAFSAADTVSKADGGQFDGAVTMANTLDMNGTELVLDADADTSITSDTDDQIDFKCGGVDRVIIGADGSFTSQPASSGTIVFNEASNDVDFRVESNDNTHGIFLDAGAGLVGIGNSNPDGHYNLADDLVIGNGSGGRGLTIYSGNDSSGYIGFNDAEQDSMTAYIQYGHNDNTMTLASSAGASLKIDSIGAVTKPLQPAFQAKVQTGGQNSFAVNSASTIIFSREVFDQNSDFDTSTYTFTAPVTGKYQLQLNVLIVYLDYDASYYQTYLQTSNQVFYSTIDPDMGGQDFTYFNLNSSVITDMDANDTAVCKILQSNGQQQTNVDTSSTFSGVLIC